MMKFWINTTSQVVILKGDEVGEGEKEEEEQEEDEGRKIMLLWIIFQIHLDLDML